VFVLRFLLRFITTFLLLLLLYQPVKAQEPAKLISTLNIGGSSNTLTIDSRYYYYQQSIGQSGIIGLSGGKNQLIRHGFIQPVAGRESSMLAGDLRVEIYPNPFSGYIIISFPERIQDAIYVTMYDLNGRIVYLKKFMTTEELNLDVSGLACSIYIMRVNTTTRSFYAKVIKLRF
jgi:hypothetical protein